MSPQPRALPQRPPSSHLAPARALRGRVFQKRRHISLLGSPQNEAPTRSRKKLIAQELKPDDPNEALRGRLLKPIKLPALNLASKNGRHLGTKTPIKRRKFTSSKGAQSGATTATAHGSSRRARKLARADLNTSLRSSLSTLNELVARLLALRGLPKLRTTSTLQLPTARRDGSTSF